jgi:hypothetical protein
LTFSNWSWGVIGGTGRSTCSNWQTAVCAARTEHSTVNTTSSASTHNWLTKARFTELGGTGSGRSLLARGMNMLVMQGIRHGMQLVLANTSSKSKLRCPHS